MHDPIQTFDATAAEPPPEVRGGDELSLRIAYFDNKCDPVPRSVDTPWSAFAQLLCGEAPTRCGKDGPLFSPTHYAPSCTRGNAAVQAISAVVLDFDDGTDPAQVLDRIGANVECVIYPTFRDHPAHRKFRLVLPLAEPCPAASWPELWRAVSTLCGNTNDVSRKDLAGMYYLPAQPTDEVAWFAAHEKASDLERAQALLLTEPWQSGESLHLQGSILTPQEWLVRAAANSVVCRAAAPAAAAGSDPAPERLNFTDSQLLDAAGFVTLAVCRQVLGQPDASEYECWRACVLLPLRNEARDHPDRADALRAAFDKASAALGGSTENNDAQWRAATVPGLDARGIGTFLAVARSGGWFEWPVPTPLPDVLPPVQPFDADLLPEALRAWVMDIAHRMQCPPDFPAVGAIVVLSSLIGARAVVQPKARDDWQVVPNLWGACVGRPGVLKSPALHEAVKQLLRLQADEAARWQPEHADWAIDRQLSELQAAAAKKKAEKVVSTDANAARALLVQTGQEVEPVARRFIVNDATVEKLCELLAGNPWGFLCYRDELYGLLASLDRQGQEGSRGFYLQGYDGNQSYTQDRIGRGTTHIPRVCFAMLGSIQPGRMHEYVRSAVEGGSGDDGLLQRFGLTVWPDVAAEFFNVDQWPDSAAKADAQAVFERLVKLEPMSDSEPWVWHFEPDAQVLFDEWRQQLEQELRGGELHPALESHLAKYRKLVPALALIFALVDTPDAKAIGRREMMRAAIWAEYLRTHAERLYSVATMPHTGAGAALLRRIKAGVLGNSFTPREVVQKGWTGLASPEAVRKAADVLMEFDWLRREIQPSSDPLGRGRPSERYTVNPATFKDGQ